VVTKNSDYDRFLQEAVECLCDSLLEDSVARVRCKAAESLGQLIGKLKIGKLKTKDGISTASQVLRKALREDPDENVREKAAEALGKIGEQPTMSGDRIINTQNYYENINTGGGNYIQGDYMSMSQDEYESRFITSSFSNPKFIRKTPAARYKGRCCSRASRPRYSQSS
jgi:oligoendopeptidase F